MAYHLELKNYLSRQEAYATIPEDSKVLDLQYNHLNLWPRSDLEDLFTHVPSFITTVILGSNLIGYDGNKISNAFAFLSPSVTTLDLEQSNLDLEQGTDLSKIPATVSALNLSRCFLLSDRTGAKLRPVLATLPPTICSLNLSQNYLGHNPTQVLVQAMRHLSVAVSTLDLSDNRLNLKDSHELATIFASFPKSITTVNLSRNGLECMSVDELKIAFSGFRAGTTVSFSGNNLFKDKTHKQRDELLMKLKTAADTNRLSLDTSNTGESDAQRASVAFQNLSHSFQKKRKHNMQKTLHDIHEDNLGNVLSFLLPKGVDPEKTHELCLFKSEVPVKKPAHKKAITAAPPQEEEIYGGWSSSCLIL